MSADEAGIGHNSEGAEEAAEMNQATIGQLKAIIERIERLEEEKKALAEDIRDVYSEAKANGFDTKVVRRLVSLRKQDADERRETCEILELYANALGMQNVFA